MIRENYKMAEMQIRIKMLYMAKYRFQFFVC